MFIHKQLNVLELLNKIELGLQEKTDETKWYLKNAACSIIEDYFQDKSSMNNVDERKLVAFNKLYEEWGNEIENKYVLDVFQIKGFKETTGTHVFKKITSIIDDFVIEGTHIQLYKGIQVRYDYKEYIKRSKKIKLGAYWVLRKENAIPPLGHQPSGGCRYIFHLNVPVEFVDWDATFMLHLSNFKTIDKEIKLHRNKKVPSFLLEECDFSLLTEYRAGYTKGKKRIIT